MRYSPNQIAKALDMRERGVMMGTIVQMTGMKPSAINYHCLFNGVYSPRNCSKCWHGKPMVRGGKLIRPFSKVEDRYIVMARKKRVTLRAIASKLDRDTSSVRTRLLILAQKQAKSEDGATPGACRVPELRAA